MMEKKRYTAQEMRRTAEFVESRDTGAIVTNCVIAAMLRQAADDMEELASVKASKNRWMQYQDTAAGERNACIDELRKKDAENAQLRARLAAVVKIAELRDNWYSCRNCAREFLRAARGEPENENK